MTRFLVAIEDNGPASTAAFDRAMRIAKANDHLILASVYEYINPAVYAAPAAHAAFYATTDRVNEEMQKVMKTNLDALAEKAKAKGISYEVVLKTGSPGATLCDIAKDEKVDVVIIGRRNVEALDRFLTGSVSVRVAQNAPCSVYIVKQPEEGHEKEQVHKYAVCLDGSEFSVKAYELARACVGSKDSLILMTHCKNSKKPEKKQAAQDVLAKYVEKAKADNIPNVSELLIESNDARDGITDAAETNNVDVVVCGTRGLGMVKRVFLGSVSTFLVEHGHSDIVVSR